MYVSSRFMGENSDDFVGPPAPVTTNKSENISAIFGGLSSIAKTVADSLVQGQLTINNKGVSYGNITPTSQAQVVQKDNTLKIIGVASAVALGAVLLLKR